MYIWYFWLENYQIYGHIRHIYTVLANPMNIRCYWQGHQPYLYIGMGTRIYWLVFIGRGTNRMYIRFFWQGNHQIYGSGQP